MTVISTPGCSGFGRQEAARDFAELCLVPSPSLRPVLRVSLFMFPEP